jgi:hypothetical protein
MKGGKEGRHRRANAPKLSPPPTTTTAAAIAATVTTANRAYNFPFLFF